MAENDEDEGGEEEMEDEAPGSASSAAAPAAAAGAPAAEEEDAPPTASSSVARSALSRPRVTLQDSAPEPAISRTPAIAPTSAQRLARATGTGVDAEPDGTQSVSFPPPGTPPAFVPFSTAPVTVTREVDTSATETAGATGASTGSAATSSTPAPTPPPPAAGAGVDVDEIADTVIDKLRREMLIEHELGGGAMDLI
jgi:pilus assembly protein FimV